MVQAEAYPAAAEKLTALAGRLEGTEGFSEVVASLRAGHGATFDGVWGSSCALLAAALARHAPGPLVVVLAYPSQVDDFCDDLALFSEADAGRFAAWELSGGKRQMHDEMFGDRLRLLKLLAAGKQPPFIVTSIQALLEGVPAPELLSGLTRRLTTLDPVDIDELAGWLVGQGFHNTSAVQLPGELSRRGGILDVFAPDWQHPVRIELFGDQVDSIRRFDAGSQRSLDALDAIEITALGPSAAEEEHVCRYLPPESWFLLVEPSQVAQEGRHWLESRDPPRPQATLDQTLRHVYRFPSVTASSLARDSMETTCRLKIESVERFSGDIAKVKGELDSATVGQQVFVVCPNDGEARRLGEVFEGTRLAASGKLHFPLGRLHAGFRLVPDRLVLVSSNELFHREELNRPSRRRLGRAIDSFLELREGDYVVHVSHGIARYRGLELLEQAGRAEDHLTLEFDGGTRLYVPASRIELVQKYVGGSKARPTLAKIGGRSWIRQKQAAEVAVVDMASEMLELQAARASQEGIRFPPDSDWQQEFDASFPYVETPDQLAGVAAIRRDMQEARPMDRLICGDVGYGKTELAMRAAFKAVDSGYQVGVLVPTTVLAEQHGRTFRSRMAEYPFGIAVLSRFCSTAQQKKILSGLAEGSIDVVIGTHRLVQGDVRFNNLGLVVIDEEQRFGVEVKERLKAFRHSVDVLTMTATPIPRTLHMSLLGLRDISNLETPPADRLAIETRVARFDDELVRQAVRRELARSGQVFFVHNRIHDIQRVGWQLQQLVPEARIGVGHGQMPEGQLERVMLDFVGHQFDILLSTTIVESGLDIPNANTIFIDDADQYGLAELHQLRGRVGRYKHRAYCYLLLNPDKSLSSTAARRLTAIEEFSDMGAGFAIAMRDLEIRGAGNILGTQQSGHIAAVGYELYCDLLEKTVRRLKNLPPRVLLEVQVDLPGEAYLPKWYVTDLRQKIDLYRRLARVASADELAELSCELVDRFGPRPKVVERLLARSHLRLLAQSWQIASIHLEDNYVVLGYTDRGAIERLARLRGRSVRIADGQSAYCPIAKGLTVPEELEAAVKLLLQPD
ncbi:MAG: transcription-repair coupling factor [Pirellulales bacterium]